MLKFWFVSRHELFDGMAPEQRQRITSLLSERECRAGEDMEARPGGESIYILKQGRAVVMNAKVAVDVLEPGHLFGTSAFTGSSLRGERVLALEDSVVCEAPASAFLAEIAQHPPAAMKMVRLLADQLTSTQDQVTRGATEALPARLADLLLKVARDANGSLELAGVSESELAAMLGTARESVSRVVAGWERRGFVRREGRRLIVSDVPAFREAAKI